MQGINAKVEKTQKELFLQKVKMKICLKLQLNLAKIKLGTPILNRNRKKIRETIKKNWT